MYGYAGAILHIRLGHSYMKTNLDESIAKSMIGGRGLGLRLILEMGIPRTINPFDPSSPLIIATGPLGGTKLPLATRAAAIFKSPLTNRWSYSTVGGTLGAYMKYAGIDALIITGSSNKPIYLVVSDGGVETRDAEWMWGMDSVQAEELIRRELGDSSILVIGPAGENAVPYATINHEKWRQFGRTGAGAVMGSKMIKAIAFLPDNKDINVANPSLYYELVKQLGKAALSNPGTIPYRSGGTVRLIDIGNSMGFFPSLYWTKIELPGWRNISWEEKLKTSFLLRNGACLYCPIACHKIVKSSNGSYDLEYESVMAIGGLTGISDPSKIIDLAELADRLGLDTVSLGNSIAFLIYLGQRGIMDNAPKWGDHEKIRELIINTAYKQGIGELIALGVRGMAEKLGVQDLAIHVKGLEPAGYDPRTLMGMSLNNAVGERGADHLWSSAYAIDISGQAGGRFSINEEKINYVIDLENRNALYDSMLLCKFGRSIYDWDTIRASLKAVTGYEYSLNELKSVSHRIIVMHRLMNGTTKADDELPRRWFEEGVEYEGKKHVIPRAELEAALQYYYELRGYDENGKPKRELLNQLGITAPSDSDNHGGTPLYE